ncbi:MAG: phage tail protein [Alphaproteobacteria bacterium]|nr:phage tail protein [Alphaproteobacteria bacterium]
MSTPFLAQIEMFSFNFAPKGWALCNGQLLPINQNQALFSLLGTTYGGDGRVNFALPDLRSRVPMSMGNGHTLGERGGAEAVTINISTLPQHSHQLQANTGDGTTTTPANNAVLSKAVASAAPGGPFNMFLYSNQNPNNVGWAGTISNTGGSQAHTNIQPYLCINFSIALQGIFPSQT